MISLLIRHCLYQRLFWESISEPIKTAGHGLAFIASIGSTRTGSCALDHPDWPLDGLDDLRVSDQNRKIIENVRKLVHCKLPKARGFLKAKWGFDRRTRSRTRNWIELVSRTRTFRARCRDARQASDDLVKQQNSLGIPPIVRSNALFLLHCLHKFGGGF